MTRKMKRIMLVTMTIILVIPFSVFANPQAPVSPDAVVDLTFLHTNDFHGRLETDSAGRGGAALIATAISEVEAEVGADHVALLDAGDVALAGPPISQLVGGQSTIEVFNLMGYDLSVFGNHEFDMGQTHLEDMVDWATFPWLGANIYTQAGAIGDFPTWMDDPPYVILTLGTAPDTVNVGVIGVANEGTPTLTLAGTTTGLVFGDPTETILEYYDEVDALSDFIIVVAHMGPEDEAPYEGMRTVAQDLEAAGKSVPLIITGHSHEPLFDPVVVGDTYIVQAGNYGRYLGRVDLTYDTDTNAVAVVSTELIPILSLDVAPETGFAPDPDVQALVDDWAEVVAPIVNEPVAVTEIPLTRDYNNESIMGDIVTDSMLWKANELDDEPVDIAFTNPGGLRAEIPENPDAEFPYTITWGDTFNVLPFGNTLDIMDLTGAQILEILNQSASLDRGILQVSGLTHKWYNGTGTDAATTYGAYDVMVGGEPLDLNATYRVVTNNFLAGGGDFWVTFTEGTNVNATFYDMQGAFVEYLDTITPVTAEDIEMGRITREYWIFMPWIIIDAYPGAAPPVE